MSLVQDLTPINLKEEKQKFFDSKCNYDPQFKYKTLVTLDKLHRYGKPKPEYINLAQKILDKAFKNRTIDDLRELQGPIITAKQGEAMIKKFLKENKMEDEIRVVWIKGHISKISIYKNKLKIRKEFDFRQKQFQASIYHELGTHALRRINYLKQPFFNKKNKHNFRKYLFTEEGLGSLHSLLASNLQLSYFNALHYLATDIAQQKSFVETFNFINQYMQNIEKSWLITVKIKRGTYDTSQPGGFTKSIVYLEGMAKVWQYLKKSNFDVAGLYLGKIDVDDIPLARELNPGFKPKLPSFYFLNPKKYQEKITEIAINNNLDDI